MDTSERSLGKEGRLLITVRMAPAKGLALHAARLWTEITRSKLPAESAEARVDLDAGLFESPLQFLDPFTDLLFVLAHPFPCQSRLAGR